VDFYRAAFGAGPWRWGPRRLCRCARSTAGCSAASRTRLGHHWEIGKPVVDWPPLSHADPATAGH
jgi:hypothetical protein